MSNPDAKPPKAHQFQPGNPGRPKGTRNALAESFLSALHADFQASGVQAVAAARVEDPLGYVKMIAGLLPQKLEIERVASAVSDDELLRIIKAGTVAERMSEQVILPNVDATGRA